MIRTFVFLILAGGAGGFLGSVAGGFISKPALFVGATLGGLITSPLAAFLAARWRWIDPASARATATGAMFGFLVAAIVALNTLSSAIGPLLSPLCVGLGGLIGHRLGGQSSFPQK